MAESKLRNLSCKIGYHKRSLLREKQKVDKKCTSLNVRKCLAPWPSGKAQVCNTFIPQFKSGWRLQKKRLVETSRFFIDINLLRDFRYVINDTICAYALDMLPAATRFISYRV